MTKETRATLRCRLRELLLYLLLTSALLGLWAILTGCAEASYWHQRTFYGIDCRPEKIKLNNGYCVSTKQGTPHVQATRP